MHDLANYLSVLVLEIEGLQNTRHSADIDGARQAIRYLEDLVDSTRQKLNGKTLRKRFDIGKEITATLAFLRYKAAKGNTSIDWEPPLKPLHYLGDPTCLAQVITVITSNAIESYALSGASAGQRRIEVVLRRDTAGPTIVISNWGKPIPHKERASLFIPFHSTKKRGMGLGLFMAKQIIEMNFSGTLTLNPNTDHTEFSITLPAAHEK